MPATLDTLFVCPRFGPLAHRACLRRQVERQEAKDAKGRVIEGPPVRPFCASGECATGRDVRQEHRALELAACPTCGTALLGDAYCPTCAARAREKAPVRHAPPSRVPVSTRIWATQPDVPFTPPAALQPPRVEAEKQEEAELVHVESAAPQHDDAPAGPPAPAAPVLVHPAAPAAASPATATGEEEEAGRRAAIAASSPTPSTPPEPEEPPMQKRTVTMPPPCPECGAKGHRHKVGCSKPSREPAPPAAVPEPEAAELPAANDVPEIYAGHLGVLKVEQLVELRRLIDAELAARLERARAEAKTIESAMRGLAAEAA